MRRPYRSRVASVLRLAAALASALILLGFVIFAYEEADKGSQRQVEKIERDLGEPDLSERGERLRERRHGPVREAIDDANDFLLSPFAGIVDSNDVWVRRLVPTVIALLLYGVGLALLANFLPKADRGPRDWRTAR